MSSTLSYQDQFEEHRYTSKTCPLKLTLQTSSLPITCLLSITSNILLYGEGSYINFYSILEKKVKFRLDVLGYQKIHKVKLVRQTQSPTQLQIVVFGGKLFKFLSFQLVEEGKNQTKVKLTRESCLVQLKDWILDLQVDLDRLEVLVLFARAFGSLFALSESWELKEKLQVQAPQNCLLYSAQYLYRVGSKYFVASGTVFNKVLIWCFDTSTKQDRGELVYSLEGHEGVIFSMFYNLTTNQLSSTSDDRTLRLWQFPQPLSTSTSAGCKALSPIKVGYGHNSRVWGGQFVDDKFIVTFGEDLTCILWKIEERSDSLQVVQRFKGHSGKNVWSCTVSEDYKYLVSGGADGGIHLFPLPGSVLEEKANQVQPLSQRSCTPISLPPINSYTKDIVNGQVDSIWSFAILNRNQFLISTRYLLSYDLTSTTTSPFQLVYYTAALKGYSLLELIQLDENSHLVGVATLSGSMLLFQMDRLNLLGEPQVVSLHSERISLLKFIRLDEDSSTYLLTYALSKSDTSYVSVAQVNPTGGIRLHPRYQLPVPDNFTVTSFTLFRHCSTLYVALGSRRGSILLYNPSLAKRFCSRLDRVHGLESITDLRYCNLVLYGVGRDGAYSELELDQDRLHLRCHSKLTKGWLEHLAPTSSSHQLVTYAFYQKRLTVKWLGGEDLVSLPCGVHQKWKSQLSLDPLKLTLLSGNQNQLQLERLGGSNRYQPATIKSGFHGREIRAAEVLGTSCGVLLLTGAEDGILVLSSLDPRPLQPQFKVKKHPSVITTIKAIDFNTLVSGGGAEAILFWELIPPHTAQGSIKVKWIGQLPSTCPISDTRVMDLCPVNHSNQLYLAVAYSDGYLRLWNINFKLHQFTVQWEAALLDPQFHQPSCTLQVKVVSTSAHSTPVVLASTTSGHLYLFPGFSWDPKPTVVQPHQCGCNGFTGFEWYGEVVIVSGGEDGTLTWTQFNCNWEVTHQVQYPQFHNAAIQGVEHLQVGQQKFICTVAADQRLQIFKVNLDGLELVITQITQVNDPSCLSIYKEVDKMAYRLVVAGVGIESFVIEKIVTN